MNRSGHDAAVQLQKLLLVAGCENVHGTRLLAYCLRQSRDRKEMVTKKTTIVMCHSFIKERQLVFINHYCKINDKVRGLSPGHLRKP